VAAVRVVGLGTLAGRPSRLGRLIVHQGEVLAFVSGERGEAVAVVEGLAEPSTTPRLASGAGAPPVRFRADLASEWTDPTRRLSEALEILQRRSETVRSGRRRRLQPARPSMGAVVIPQIYEAYLDTELGLIPDQVLDDLRLQLLTGRSEANALLVGNLEALSNPYQYLKEVRDATNAPILVGLEDPRSLIPLQDLIDRAVVVGSGGVEHEGPLDYVIDAPGALGLVTSQPEDLGARNTFTLSLSETRRHNPSGRYLNLIFAYPGDGVVSKTDSLSSRTSYELRISVGPRLNDSILENSPAFPDDILPASDDGHWLEVAVFSDTFEISDNNHRLFLPRTGASWVCECDPDREHTCDLSQRLPFSAVAVRTPANATIGDLRVCVYYHTNLIQSAIARVTIGQTSMSSGQSALIDYSITAGYANLDDTPGRSISIMTNENIDGSHRVVVNHRLSEPFAFSVESGQMASAMLRARGTLFDAQFRNSPDGLQSLFDGDFRKGRDQFVQDLCRLALKGWLLLSALYTEGAVRDRLRDLVQTEAESSTDPVLIQVARAAGSDLVYPWQLIYDLPLAGESTDFHPCPFVDEWLASDPDDRSLPHASRCPRYLDHDMNTVCLFGFWGFSSVLECPPSRRADHPAPKAVTTSTSPVNVVCGVSNTLDPGVTRNHLIQLGAALGTSLGEPFHEVTELAQRLKESDLDLVYFYCHGKKIVEQHGDGTIEVTPVIEIGNASQFAPGDVSGWDSGIWRPYDPDHWRLRQPVIILNGCHTTDLLPDQLLTFVTSFIGANASGVIGTEIAVEQGVAGHAVETLVREVAHNKPIGTALRAMRWSLLLRGNVMGLAYTPYCSAELALRSSGPTF
jgi:hypothetical protein